MDPETTPAEVQPTPADATALAPAMTPELRAALARPEVRAALAQAQVSALRGDKFGAMLAHTGAILRMVAPPALTREFRPCEDCRTPITCEESGEDRCP